MFDDNDDDVVGAEGKERKKRRDGRRLLRLLFLMILLLKFVFDNSNQIINIEGWGSILGIEFTMMFQMVTG